LPGTGRKEEEKCQLKRSNAKFKIAEGAVALHSWQRGGFFDNITGCYMAKLRWRTIGASRFEAKIGALVEDPEAEEACGNGARREQIRRITSDKVAFRRIIYFFDSIRAGLGNSLLPQIRGALFQRKSLISHLTRRSKTVKRVESRDGKKFTI
jgi:hypothetical protein